MATSYSRKDNACKCSYLADPKNKFDHVKCLFLIYMIIWSLDYCMIINTFFQFFYIKMCTSLGGGTCLRFYTKAPKAFALKCAPRFYQHCCYVQICCFFMLPIFAVSLGCIVMVHFKIHQNNKYGPL